ncbi:hypothetical protein [Clostridium sp. HBUAS56010]|uniref:hypothetical protein n=1 Tax=Clostridium sp. HBUAS56010 TaxID=2571127 RepID=UPI00163DAA5B|nr:hypothetical protein [Clostridium sp. HBUAS56010]
MRKAHVSRNKEYKKELKTLASDFRVIHREEVQEAIRNCQNYDDGRRKILKVYEMVYL